MHAQGAEELPPNYHGLPFTAVQAGVAFPAFDVKAMFLVDEAKLEGEGDEAKGDADGSDGEGKAAGSDGDEGPKLPPRTMPRLPDAARICLAGSERADTIRPRSAPGRGG